MDESEMEIEKREFRERLVQRTLTDVDIARMTIGSLAVEMGTPQWVANYQRLFIIEDDITRIQADVIVNAANESLLGGGGVDGAIHRAAGPGLLAECRTLGGCPTGSARITRGYNLPAKWVIHTVGPVWNGRGKDEERSLHNCYENSLELARIYNARSVAFPAISTGAYGFLLDRAAHIATQAIGNHLRKNRSLEGVYLVCFDRRTYVEYFVALHRNHGSAGVRFALGENKDEWLSPELLVRKAKAAARAER